MIHKTHNHLTGAKHDVARAERHAEDLFAKARARIERLSSDARTRGRALLESVKDRGGDIIDQARDRSERALKDAKSWAGENPGQVAGVAFVAGVLAHRWLTRRKD